MQDKQARNINNLIYITCLLLDWLARSAYHVDPSAVARSIASQRSGDHSQEADKMKLRIKHVAQPGHVHRIEVASTSLGDLQAAVAGTVTFAEGASAADVVVSLNKKVWFWFWSAWCSGCVTQLG
jgi:hypothetical protein